MSFLSLLQGTFHLLAISLPRVQRRRPPLCMRCFLRSHEPSPINSCKAWTNWSIYVLGQMQNAIMNGLPSNRQHLTNQNQSKSNVSCIAFNYLSPKFKFYSKSSPRSSVVADVHPAYLLWLATDNQLARPCRSTSTLRYVCQQESQTDLFAILKS